MHRRRSVVLDYSRVNGSVIDGFSGHLYDIELSYCCACGLVFRKLGIERHRRLICIEHRKSREQVVGFDTSTGALCLQCKIDMDVMM